jgi:hypothetical protein
VIVLQHVDIGIARATVVVVCIVTHCYQSALLLLTLHYQNSETVFSSESSTYTCRTGSVSPPLFIALSFCMPVLLLPIVLLAAGTAVDGRLLTGRVVIALLLLALVIILLGSSESNFSLESSVSMSSVSIAQSSSSSYSMHI